MLAVYFGFLLLFPCLSLCNNPGLKVQITRKGIDYGFQLGIEAVKKMIQNMNPPVFTGQVGPIKFTISGLRVLHPSYSESSMSLVPPTGLHLSLQDVTFTLQGNWRINFAGINPHGSADIFVSRLSISSSVGLTRDSAGRPKMQSNSCQTTISSTIVGESMDKLIQASLQNVVEELINKNLCMEMNKLIERLNTYLTTMEVSTQFGQYVELQYGLVGQPLIREDYIDLNFKGSFRSTRNHTEPPFSPDQLEMTKLCNQTQKMLCIGISEYFFNSAAYASFMAGALSLDIADNMIPHISHLRLTTDILALFIPEIMASYTSAPILLHLSVHEPPQFAIEQDTLLLMLSATMQIFAVLPNSSKEQLIHMRLQATFTIGLRVSGQKICGYISDSNFHFILTNIFIGSYQCNRVLWEMNPANQEVSYCTPEGKSHTKPVNEQIKLTSLCKQISDRHLAAVKMIMSQASDAIIIPTINEKLNEGFPLPIIDNIKFMNSSLKSYQGFFLIATDVEFLS
ncbi:bactericidal permeability-increasing protein-like [Protopterus annectens]|uniref:bactericidal permeability-increasing protein-like n=1 Tax=Protopterus annectens TaxID=7888 RepID=UPI001CFAD22F|nr:bactericidal permeability-increasing protein-like [Protopterus annectens]XP_043946259.1 bactericidal permeability-increasing protein-like [Protopterus annectens]